MTTERWTLRVCVRGKSGSGYAAWPVIRWWRSIDWASMADIADGSVGPSPPASPQVHAGVQEAGTGEASTRAITSENLAVASPITLSAAP